MDPTAQVPVQEKVNSEGGKEWYPEIRRPNDEIGKAGLIIRDILEDENITDKLDDIDENYEISGLLRRLAQSDRTYYRTDTNEVAILYDKGYICLIESDDQDRVTRICMGTVPVEGKRITGKVQYHFTISSDIHPEDIHPDFTRWTIQKWGPCGYSGIIGPLPTKFVVHDMKEPETA